MLCIYYIVFSLLFRLVGVFYQVITEKKEDNENWKREKKKERCPNQKDERRIDRAPSILRFSISLYIHSFFLSFCSSTVVYII